MFNKALYAFIAIIFLGLSGMGLSEKVMAQNISSMKKLSLEELEFWNFFASVDTVGTYLNVIREYFNPDRSESDKIRGVQIVVGLIKNKVNDGGLLRIESFIKKDEDFFNTFMWSVKDINFKKYVLQFILLDKNLKLEEKTLLKQYSDKFDIESSNRSIFLKLFDKYSTAVNLTEKDYDLMIAALVLAHGDKELLKDMDDIKGIILKFSSNRNIVRLKKVLDQVISNAVVFNKEYYVPQDYEFIYEQGPSDSLTDFISSLNTDQILGLLKIAVENSGTFNTFFIKLDNDLLKEEILKILLKARDKNLVEKFILNIFEIYKGLSSLTEDDGRIISFILSYVEKSKNKDLVQEVLDIIKESEWIKENEKGVLESLGVRVEVLLGVLDELAKDCAKNFSI